MGDRTEPTRIGASLQRVLAERGKEITFEEAHELATGLLRLAELGFLVPIRDPALEAPGFEDRDRNRRGQADEKPPS